MKVKASAAAQVVTRESVVTKSSAGRDTKTGENEEGEASGISKVEKPKGEESRKSLVIAGKGGGWNASWLCNFPLLSALLRFFAICKAPINAQMNQGTVAGDT